VSRCQKRTSGLYGAREDYIMKIIFALKHFLEMTKFCSLAYAI